MGKRLERSLSTILSLFVLVVFLLTIASNNFNIWLISYIWYVSFLIAWIFMLIYALHVLMQKDSLGYSIIVAILTAIGFGLLSIPAIIMLSRFISLLPSALTYNNQFLDSNTQAVIYTTLIVLYFAHLFNTIKLNAYQNKKFSEKEENFQKNDIITVIPEDNILDDYKDEELINLDNHDNTDNNEVSDDYEIEEVVKVEDLEEEIDFRKGEE